MIKEYSIIYETLSSYVNVDKYLIQYSRSNYSLLIKFVLLIIQYFNTKYYARGDGYPIIQVRILQSLIFLKHVRIKSKGVESILNRIVRKNGRFDEYCAWYFLDLHRIEAVAAFRIHRYIYFPSSSDLLSRTLRDPNKMHWLDGLLEEIVYVDCKLHRKIFYSVSLNYSCIFHHKSFRYILGIIDNVWDHF